MRVTLLGQFFPPETFAGANRIHALAAALGREHDVTVVAPRPSYPQPSLYAGRPEIESPPGVRVVRTATFVPHERSLVGRALGEQQMAARLALAASGTRPDVVVASSPGMFVGPAALALSRLRRVPFVWDLRDLTWEYAVEVTAGERLPSLAAAAVRRSMWRVARRADLLVAATPGIAEALRSGAPGANVVLVANTIASDLLELLDPSPPPERERPLVAYAGLVGAAQALVVLNEVAARLPEVDFAVVGQGPQLDYVTADARRRGLANIVFHGYLPPHRVAEVYRDSSILFAQLHASPLHAATALPSKLFEYMAAGRPIVYAGEGLAAGAVERIGCGIAVAPGDAGMIAAAIAELLGESGGAHARGLAGRRHAEGEPSREEGMSSLLPELERLVRRLRPEPAIA